MLCATLVQRLAQVSLLHYHAIKRSAGLFISCNSASRVRLMKQQESRGIPLWRRETAYGIYHATRAVRKLLVPLPRLYGSAEQAPDTVLHKEMQVGLFLRFWNASTSSEIKRTMNLGQHASYQINLQARLEDLYEMFLTVTMLKQNLIVLILILNSGRWRCT